MSSRDVPEFIGDLSIFGDEKKIDTPPPSPPPSPGSGGTLEPPIGMAPLSIKPNPKLTNRAFISFQAMPIGVHVPLSMVYSSLLSLTKDDIKKCSIEIPDDFKRLLFTKDLTIVACASYRRLSQLEALEFSRVLKSVGTRVLGIVVERVRRERDDHYHPALLSVEDCQTVIATLENQGILSSIEAKMMGFLKERVLLDYVYSSFDILEKMEDDLSIPSDCVREITSKVCGYVKQLAALADELSDHGSGSDSFPTVAAYIAALPERNHDSTPFGEMSGFSQACCLGRLSFS